jgi:hypothetical protein
MSWGGKRLGAGKKKGARSLLTQELRERINAGGCIQFLQDLVDGRVRGATIGERKDAAVQLLRKVLPDLSHQQSKVGFEGGVIKILQLPERDHGHPGNADAIGGKHEKK